MKSRARVIGLCLIPVFGLIAGCSGGGGAKGKHYAIHGVSQKGPFVTGSSVTVQELDGALNQTGRSFDGQITEDTGSFTVAASVESPLVEVIAQGYYFDEVANVLSGGPLTLRAYASLSEGTAVNVNIVTTLATKRIVALVTSGATFAAAQQQAESDVLAAFSIPSTGVGAAQSFDETGADDSARVLLAISAIVQNAAVRTTPSPSQTTATLTQLIAQVGADLADGTLDSPNLRDTLSRAGRYLDATSIRSNLQQRYDSLGDAVTIPDFTGFLDDDGDGVLNKDETDPPLALGTPMAMATPRYAMLAAPLPGGRILVAGGTKADNSGGTSGAEVIDPVTGSATPVGSMTGPRQVGAIAALHDGRVLVAGGGGADGGTAQVYDPATAVFGTAMTMASARGTSFTATTLDDGRVLLAGGDGTSPGAADGELFDPTNSTFTPVGTSVIYRALHTATLLADGTVLLVGGADLGNSPNYPIQASAEIFDPNTGMFTATGSMQTPREGHTATLLPDGRVLVVGGYDGTGAVATAEVYDPMLGTFSQTDYLEVARAYAAAGLVAGGKVAIAGGDNALPVQDQSIASIELYDPGSGLFSRGPADLHISMIQPQAVVFSNGSMAILGAKPSPDAITPGEADVEVISP